MTWRTRLLSLRGVTALVLLAGAAALAGVSLTADVPEGCEGADAALRPAAAAALAAGLAAICLPYSTEWQLRWRIVAAIAFALVVWMLLWINSFSQSTCNWSQ